jgi:hypothetical protein
MKSEHRHDLKTNELAEWIANLPQWAREEGRKVIYISAALLLVVGSGLWYWRKISMESVQKQTEFTSLLDSLSKNKLQILMGQSRGVDTSYTLIETAAAFQTSADGAKEDQMAALSLIKRAEALRAGLHYRQQTVSPTEVRNVISDARAAYNAALERPGISPSLTAMARFGLGLCEEELGNFDGARQIYRDIVTNSDFEYTTAVVKAENRLETMDDYQQRVVFRAAPKPLPTPTTQTQELTPDDFLQPPIPLRPIEPTLVSRAPNRVPVAPDVDVEPNGVSGFPRINLKTQTPDNTPGISEINVPSE